MSHIKLKKLVKKITKSDNNDIINAIMTNEIPISHAISKVSQLVRTNPPEPYMESKVFIGNKILSYLKANYPSHVMSTTTNILDIGGGEGLLLQHLGEKLILPANNLVCIETVNDWYEPYNYDEDDPITRMYWNENSLFERDNSIEKTNIPIIPDITFIMVAMHHMCDVTIRRILGKLSSQCEKGSLLIVKEHDCCTRSDAFIIDWEHHLYHIINSSEITPSDAEEYMKTASKHNYKSRTTFDQILIEFGYLSRTVLNNIFDPIRDCNDNAITNIIYKSNSSNLYWTIYEKIK